MRVLIAPNAFKGTLSAPEVAHAIGTVMASHGHEVDAAPMSDGGDGTLEAFLAAGYAPVGIEIDDAAHRRRTSLIALRESTAVVELARTCGLAGVSDLPMNPWAASSLGLGQAARSAIDVGARSVVLALGGSASVDGGVGFLQGLGFDVIDDDGLPVTPDALGMSRARSIGGQCDPTVEWTVLADVDNPLLGPAGAIMFAAQKGLKPTERRVLDDAWTSWSRVLAESTGVDVGALPHAGAAGGIAGAAHAVLGATLSSGARRIALMLDLGTRIRNADLVITGEGCFDDQTLRGKAPGVVIDFAYRSATPVAVIAGRIEAGVDGLAAAVATSLAPGAGADHVRDLGWAAEEMLTRLRPAPESRTEQWRA